MNDNLLSSLLCASSADVGAVLSIIPVHPGYTQVLFMSLGKRWERERLAHKLIGRNVMSNPTFRVWMNAVGTTAGPRPLALGPGFTPDGRWHSTDPHKRSAGRTRCIRFDFMSFFLIFPFVFLILISFFLILYYLLLHRRHTLLTSRDSTIHNKQKTEKYRVSPNQTESLFLKLSCQWFVRETLNIWTGCGRHEQTDFTIPLPSTYLCFTLPRSDVRVNKVCTQTTACQVGQQSSLPVGCFWNDPFPADRVSVWQSADKARFPFR